MKTLSLIRHAKSSWKYPELDDFERPLNKRGKRDLPLMANRLVYRKTKPDLILSSPALRAATTARTIAEIIHFPVEQIVYDEKIYDADSYALFDIIRQQDDNHKNVFLIGHNPALTTLANLICTSSVDNIPTCGIFNVEMDIQNWAKLSERCANLKYFEYPKGVIR